MDRRIDDRVLERIWAPGVRAHEVRAARGAVVVPHRGKVLPGKAVILAPWFRVCLVEVVTFDNYLVDAFAAQVADILAGSPRSPATQTRQQRSRTRSTAVRTMSHGQQ